MHGFVKTAPLFAHNVFNELGFSHPGGLADLRGATNQMKKTKKTRSTRKPRKEKLSERDQAISDALDVAVVLVMDFSRHEGVPLEGLVKNAIMTGFIIGMKSGGVDIDSFFGVSGKLATETIQ